MTNKEASDILDDYDVNFEGHTAREVAEAFDCAFKALDQEPCEDAISRQDTIELAKKGVLISNGNYKSVCKAINELPSVTPQPKTGHWIYKQYDGYAECGDYHCSECDKVDNRMPAYCPHCGCRMNEPQESEE